LQAWLGIEHNNPTSQSGAFDLSATAIIMGSPEQAKSDKQ